MSNDDNKHKHILVCIDGLIGVGKSTLCHRLPQKYSKNNFKINRFLETAHSFSLPTLEKFISSSENRIEGGNIYEIDSKSRLIFQDTQNTIKEIGEHISELEKLNKNNDDIVVMNIIEKLKSRIEVLNERVSIFKKNWENEVFGIFQNVMISSSYSTILNNFPIDDLTKIKKISERDLVGCSSNSSSSSSSSSDSSIRFSSSISTSSGSDDDDLLYDYQEKMKKVMVDISSSIKNNNITEVMLLDRDPISNRIFFEILDSQNLLSPVSKFFYESVYSDYTKRFMNKSFEIWLWCEPKTALSRIYHRGREEEKRHHTEDTLWVYQNIKLRDLILSYCDKIFIKENERNSTNFGKYIACNHLYLKNRNEKRPCFVIPWCKLNHENDNSQVDSNIFGDDKSILDKIKLWKNNCNNCIFDKYLPKISLYIDSDQKLDDSSSATKTVESIFKFSVKNTSMINFGKINYFQYKIPYQNKKSSSPSKFCRCEKNQTKGNIIKRNPTVVVIEKNIIVIKSKNLIELIEDRNLNNKLFKLICRSNCDNQSILNINIFLKENPFKPLAKK